MEKRIDRVGCRGKVQLASCGPKHYDVRFIEPASRHTLSTTIVKVVAALSFILAFSILDTAGARRAKAVPMTFEVNSVADTADAGSSNYGYGCTTADYSSLDPALLPGPDGEITLREAICAANANPGPDMISFNISGAGPHTIFATMSLPGLIDGGTTLDGTTQPGYAGSPVVEIRRMGGSTGLAIEGGGTIVRGLSVTGYNVSFPGAADYGYAIHIYNSTASGTIIESNYIGIEPDGLTANPNDIGIYIVDGASGVIVGGSAPAQGNLISGNRIGLWTSTDNNIIQNNLIGTDASGMASVGNTDFGIAILGPFMASSTGNQVLDNVISGNTVGLQLSLGATDVTVQGNKIGTDPTGTAAVANERGLDVAHGDDNVIGGTGPGEGNLISGNTEYGMDIRAGANNNQVIGNLIGTDMSGTAALPNGEDGLHVEYFSDNNLITGNVISGNTTYGIWVRFSSEYNVIQGNMIGTDAGGSAALPNGVDGILINSDSPGTLIGGSDPSSGNVISGNTGHGIHILSIGLPSVPEGTIIQGNKIGADVTGTVDLGNGGSGIRVQGPNTVIGGATPAEGNLISGNFYAGVYLFINSDGSLIQNNLIGTDVTGALPLGNGYGVYVSEAENISVQNNIIAHHIGSGVIVYFEASSVTISQNSTFENGGEGISLLPYLWSDWSDAPSSELPNDGIAIPELTAVTTSLVEGTACDGCTVEVFRSDADPSGYGEGQEFLAAGTAAGGVFSIDLTAAGGLGACETATATATDASGNTSEFSLNAAPGGVVCVVLNYVPLPIFGMIVPGLVTGFLVSRRVGKNKLLWSMGGFAIGAVLGGALFAGGVIAFDRFQTAQVTPPAGLLPTDSAQEQPVQGTPLPTPTPLMLAPTPATTSQSSTSPTSTGTPVVTATAGLSPTLTLTATGEPLLIPTDTPTSAPPTDEPTPVPLTAVPDTQGPKIGNVSHVPEPIMTEGCKNSITVVSATINDPSGVGMAEVRWKQDIGGTVITGTAPMKLEQDQWIATLGPFGKAGLVSYTVYAQDANGNPAEVAGPGLTVLSCR